MSRLFLIILLFSFLSIPLVTAQDAEIVYLPITLENINRLERIAILDHELDDTVKAISQLAFHPTQSWLLSQEFNETVRVWNMDEFNFVEALPLPTVYSTNFAISPDGETLVYGGWDFESQPDFATINVWNFETQENLQLVRDGQYSVDILAFNPAGTLFATAGLPFQGAIRVWSTESGELIFETDYWLHVFQIAFTTDNLLITAGQDEDESQIRIWNIETQELVDTLHGYYFVLHPSRQYIIVTNNDSQGDTSNTTLYDLQDMDNSNLREFSGTPFAFNPSGEIVAVSSSDGVWLNDFETGERLVQLRDFGTQILAFSPDNRFVAVPSEEGGLGTIDIWGIPSH